MSSFARRVLTGAAQGGAALGMVSIAEILFHSSRDALLSRPLADGSMLATVGIALGAVIGALRSLRPLRSLAPWGIALGLAISLYFWLGSLERVVGSRTTELAWQGAAWILAGLAAGQLFGIAARRITRLRGHLFRDGALVLLLALPWIGGRFGPSRSTASDRPNVLLVTIDTLRSDRLGYSGNPRPVSPHLDRLARTGEVHVRAVTTLPRTLPAFATLFTGEYPHAHGVRDNFHYGLGPAAITLAESLRDAGWATAAINSNPVLSHDSGIYQGFQTASDRGDDWSRLTLIRGLNHLRTLVAMRVGDRATVISDLARSWLDSRPRDRPFFLWVHWLSPHMPYEPAYPFATRFDPGYEGEYRDALDYGPISKGDMTYRNPLSPRTRAHAVALYDGEIATADRALGRLLRSMEMRGELANTWILFTADHGESLLEHGYFFNHGDFVYGPAANVPLVVRGPGSRHEITARVPSLVEIVPRVRALAGLPDGETDAESSPTDRARFGESGFCRFPDLNDRLGFQLPKEIAQSPDLVPDWRETWEEQANRAKQRFVEIGEWKLVRSPRETGDVSELFDLRFDPGETTNVADSHPDLARELSAALDAWILAGSNASSTAEDRTIDDATRERLRGLGYLGD